MIQVCRVRICQKLRARSTGYLLEGASTFHSSSDDGVDDDEEHMNHDGDEGVDQSDGDGEIDEGFDLLVTHS